MAETPTGADSPLDKSPDSGGLVEPSSGPASRPSETPDQGTQAVAGTSGRRVDSPPDPPNETDGSRKPPRRENPVKRLYPAGAALVAFILFVGSPFGDLIKGPILGIGGPAIRRGIDVITNKVGIPDIQLSKTLYTTNLAAIDEEIHDGEPTPNEGCYSEEWLARRNGIAAFNEALARITTHRSDVVLIDANLKFRLEPRTARTAVMCMEGGDGAITLIEYTIFQSGPTTRTISGPGANADGSRLSLPLTPGVEYPVAVTVSAGDATVASWSGELVFMVGVNRRVVNIGEGRVAGVTGLPVFAAEGSVWKRR